MPNTLPEEVVKLVAVLPKTRSVKDPVLVDEVGVLPKLQLAGVLRLALLPVKMLGGVIPMLRIRFCDELGPAGFSAVKITIVSPSVVGIPLINPVTVFKFRPAGRLAAA